MYQLNLLEGPKKLLGKIKDKKLLLRLVKAIESLKHNPFPQNSKKLKGNVGYRLRIGDYRILYELENSRLIIIVIKIGHRSEVYR